MPIKVGDKLPEAKFRVMTAEGPAWKTTDEVFKGKKVALFAVPGAFTPTCHKIHLPSFVKNCRRHQGQGRGHHRGDGGQRCVRHEAWKKETGADGKVEFSPTATAISPRRST